MSTRVEVEDVRTTKGEKLLAVVLTVFLLIGGVWAYQKIDDAVRSSTPPDFSYRGTPDEQAAVTRLEGANADSRPARCRRARDNLEFRREAYRTALDANRPAAELERPTTGAAQARPGSTRSAVRGEAPSPRRNRPPSPLRARSPRSNRALGERELLAFVFRSRSYSRASHSATGSWRTCGGGGSRYYPVGIAVVAYAAILAFAMAATT